MGGPQNHWQRGGYGGPGGFQGRGGGRGRGGGGRGRGRGQGDADDGVVAVDTCYEIVGQHNDTRNEKRIVVATNHRRLVSHAPDTMIFAYHVCNVSEKTAPPVVEAGAENAPPASAVAPAAAGSAAPAASEAAPIALGDANTTPLTAANTAPSTAAADTAPSTSAHESGVAAAAQRARRKVPEARKRKNANGVDRVKRYHGLPLLYDGESKLFSSVDVRSIVPSEPGRRAGSFVVAAPAPGGRRVCVELRELRSAPLEGWLEEAGLGRGSGLAMIDIALRAQFERGGFHALGGGEFVGARAVQPLNKYGRVDDELARRLVELGCELRVGVALTASRLDAGLCVNYDLMARLTIKSVNVAELMLGLFGLRGNRPEKLVPDEIKKLHDLLKKKLCEVNRGSRWAGPPEIIQLARKLFDPSGTYATADSESFDKGGKPRTVTAHYRIAYGIELQYPWLPLLAVDCGAVRVRCRDEHGADVLDQNGRPTFDVAKENGKAMRKRIHFPPELLQLVEHQKHSANEAELLRTAVCKIPKRKLAESNRLLGDAGLVGADDQSLLSSVGLALSRPLAVRGRVLDPPIVAFKDRVRRDADGRPQTYYVPAKTDLRNGEALPPQNNAYEFFDVKNTDADVQRWLVLDVTGHFLPRQAIAEFFDLVGQSLYDRGLKHWPEWDYCSINPHDIENFVRDLGAKSARERPDYVTPVIIKDKTKAMSPSKPYDRLKKAFGGKVMTGCVGIETIQKQRAAELSKLATSVANNIVGKLRVVVKRTFPATSNLWEPSTLSAAHPLLDKKTLLVSVHVEQGGGAFCQNVSSFVSMVAAKTQFCDEFIERHAPVEPGADIASALTRPFGEIVYGLLELFEKSADLLVALRLSQEHQPSAWFLGTRESLAQFRNPSTPVVYEGERLEGYESPPWSRAPDATPIAYLDRGSRAMSHEFQLQFTERCFDFKIIVLRGGFGASENLEVEPPYLEDALGKLGCPLDKLPKITYVVCKDSKTRLAPCEAVDRDNPKSRNVRPGTIIDSAIVQPGVVDWLMLSHRSIQGTSTLQDVRVIRDDSRLDRRDLQELLYYLTWSYPKANCAVRKPVPLYIAKLAATREHPSAKAVLLPTTTRAAPS